MLFFAKMFNPSQRTLQLFFVSLMLTMIAYQLKIILPRNSSFSLSIDKHVLTQTKK